MTVAAPNRVLTERSAVDLARGIRRRELSAREVVEAHIAVCRRAHPRINAIVVDRYETALVAVALEFERAYGGSAAAPQSAAAGAAA